MRSIATDPLRNFKFQVTIFSNALQVPSTIAQLGFMTCDGFGVQNEVIPYREGGDNTTTRKMPGQTDFGPITLGRGMMSAPTGPGKDGQGGTAGTKEIYSWLGMVFSAVEGGGTNDGTGDFRTNVAVDILEHPNTSGGSGSANAAGLTDQGSGPVKARFLLFNAWPMALNWSGLDAGGNAIVIETLQLAHEGFNVYYGLNTGGPSSYLSGAGLVTA